MTTAAELDDDQDPEAREPSSIRRCASGRCFRRRPGSSRSLLFGLSCFHYYTAGFGLLQETLHRGIHIACVLGLIFLVFSWSQKGNAATPRAGAARAARDRHRRLALRHRGRRHQPLRPVRLPRSPVPRRQSRPDRLDHGHGHDRGAARGDAPQRRLAAADHRGRAHGLRALRAVVAGHSRASRQHVEKRRQPPLSHEPGHLRHRARRGGDLRLPLRAVRRAGDARRARPLLHRSRDRADRPLLRRARQGLDLRLGACSA